MIYWARRRHTNISQGALILQLEIIMLMGRGCCDITFFKILCFQIWFHSVSYWITEGALPPLKEKVSLSSNLLVFTVFHQAQFRSEQLPCQSTAVAFMAKPMSTGPSGHLSMDSLVGMGKEMSMADFFIHGSTLLQTEQKTQSWKGKHWKLQEGFHYFWIECDPEELCDQKNPGTEKKIKNSSHLFCSPNTRLAVLNCSSQLHSLKHSFPKLSDRTHRFSFLAVEAECLLNQLKPITLAVTTGDLNSLVFYSLQLLFTLLCVLSVFSYTN